MAHTTPTVITIGIAGLGRRGMHHLERLSFREDFQVIAVHDAVHSRARDAKHLCARFLSSRREFFADRTFDAALIATPPRTREGFVREATAAGKHVAVESPPGDGGRDAKAMVEAARRAGRMVAILPASRFDPDFPTVRSVVSSGCLGRVLAAKRILWGRRVPSEASTRGEAGPHPLEAPEHETTGRRETPESGCEVDDDARGVFPPVLLEPVTVCLEELLDLIREPICSVFATHSGGLSGGLFTQARSIAIRLGFLSGATAEIDVDVDSLVPLRTGWVISGSDGGYRKLRRYERSRAQEIFDIPVEPIENDSDRIYDDLAKLLREEAVDESFSAGGWQVVRLLEAARWSAETRKVVTLEAVTRWPDVW